MNDSYNDEGLSSVEYLNSEPSWNVELTIIYVLNFRNQNISDVMTPFNG